MSSGATMKIGEVHALLRTDFPGIELSKIRYYEDKGLVQPARSKKGYRLYSERDVECLREAIRLAQEEFVPLRVVRLRLIEKGLLAADPIAPTTRRAAREAGLGTVVAAAPVVEPRPAARPLAVARPALDGPQEVQAAFPEFYSRTELLNASSTTEKELHAFHESGLLAPVTFGTDVLYTHSDVQIAAWAGALIRRGIDLRILVATRRVAEREVGVLEDALRSLHLEGPRAGEDARAISDALSGIRGALFTRAQQDFLRDL